MPSEKVSNGIIFELLKARGHGADEQSRRMDDFYDLLKEIKVEQREQGQRIRGLEDKIDGIRISWSSKLIAGILATSAVTSAVVALATVTIS